MPNLDLMREILGLDEYAESEVRIAQLSVEDYANTTATNDKHLNDILTEIIDAAKDARKARRGGDQAVALSNLFGQRLATKRYAYELLTQHAR